MNSSLGVYFGPKAISVTETKGKKLIKSIQIPQPVVSGGELEDKVPVEAKIIQLVALFKDELRKNQIDAKNATICLSGKDLIIRTFEVPVLPRGELRSAVNFEAKKYIPFKGEDLISDFQVQFDPVSRINQVLFVAIKKQSLNRYLELLKQLNIGISTIEYSAFSLLRFLKISGAKDKGITAIVSADLRGEDEANFIVLESGFPLFSRDFSLTPASGFAKAEGPPVPDSGMALEKFKTEIRVSLDYFHRKFSDKNIQKVLLIANPDYRADLEAFMREMSIPVQFIDIVKEARFMGKAVTFSLDLVKSYASSLSARVRTRLRLNLLAAKEGKEIGEKGPAFDQRIAEFLIDLKIDFRVVIAAILICAGVFAFGVYRVIPFRQEVAKAISMRPKVSTVNSGAGLEELSGIDSQYKKKIKALDNLIKNQLFLTEPLDVIPRIIPDGVWLTDFSYSYKPENNKRELLLQGEAYLGDGDRELETVNKFLADLKTNQQFGGIFKDIKIMSLQQKESRDRSITSFTISCKGY